MKKVVYIPLLLLAVALMGSCTLENSDNGKLDGFWYLSYVDTLATGCQEDMRDAGITWSFQHKLLEVRTASGGDVFFRFRQSPDSLVLSEPAKFVGQGMEEEITDISLLAPLGINQLEEHYRIVSLTSSKMALHSETLRLYFKKL